MPIKIALTPRICDLEVNKEGVNQTYIDALNKAGALAYMLTINHDYLDEMVKDFDGLLVTGGDDIEPHHYGEEKRDNTPVYPLYDAFDFAVIDAFYKAKKPILGICRGMQVLNVYFGGTLYQDIDTDYKDLNRLHYKNELENKMSHAVKINKDSRLYKLLNKEEILVNSYHHQAVKDVAEGFLVSAISDDGIIEAFEREGVCATQFHPEKSHEIEDQFKIIKAFVDECKALKK